MTHKTPVKLSITVLIVGLAAGCHQIQHRGHRLESGYSDAGKVQIQFYSPPGTKVTVANQFMGLIVPSRSHPIGSGGDGDHRLEVEPEETATFNLAPGIYPFKYNAAGWKGVSIYGEIEISPVWCPVSPAREFIRQSFIPIALPGPATLEAASAKDDRFPYQSPAHRLRISYQDVERLAAGDMVTKVVFLADLKKAQTRVDKIELELVGLRGKRQWLQGLLNQAHMDAISDPSSKKFISLMVKLKTLDQKIDKKEDLQTRLAALLDADNVLIRREMLALATDELLDRHEDPVVSARKLGQVLLVMRIGGRHRHWGAPAQEPDKAVH